MRRLVISCDGTWNDPADRTNVWKVREVVARTPEQPEPYYDPGVGTAVGDRILGGAFGDGLSRNIREAYRWLCKTYQDGDDLFLFGFSRGAFTVRSLAGFVRTIGLLPAGQLEAIDAGYDLYRSRVDKNNTKRIRDLQEFQAKYGSRPIEQIDIAFLGVWDTVGALGVPVVGLRSWLASRWRFHDYELSSWVRRAYQALAIDERRTPFMAALWKVPDESSDTDPVRATRRAEQVVEQVWFAGCHSDIGGNAGEFSFEWMMRKAREAGLQLDDDQLGKYLPAARSTPGRRESLSLGYQLFAGAVDRPIGAREFPSQSVHPSVDALSEGDSLYNPENLRLARADTPMQAPRSQQWWYTARPFQRFYLRQYDRFARDKTE